jgi:hypothetical protein
LKSFIQINFANIFKFEFFYSAGSGTATKHIGR